ncbi:MAG: HEAT repeat domain-containing protein [Methylococcales bacterium]
MTHSASRYSGILAAGVTAALVVGMSWFYFAPSKREGRTLELATEAPTPSVEPPPRPALKFAGRAACAGCHAEQDRLWQGSHHDLAMQEASEQTVLGDFRNAEFRKDGVVSRFFRKDGHYLVRTDGPDGKLADYEIKYTFGFTPLQQYLVEFPGGRLQALSIAWDSRPGEQGGRRWFHLYPNERITHADELHWTKRSQNWNFMCGECHSTNLLKNYDPLSRAYRTAWSEIDVSCEACHGPGSQHLAWAGRMPDFERSDPKSKGLAVLLNERQGVQWTIDPPTGNAHRSTPRGSDNEIQICARCHARRAQLFGDYRYGQLMDTHLPSLLRETLYHADGQIDGEVYEYGSFQQSKMYRAGVSCGDCHEPHSLKLRAPGNGVCLQCHGKDKYHAEKHHFHGTGSAGASCVGCHMPAKTYMVVDPRRDHGFRIPRPDLSERLGAPDACTACHSDKSARWAADRVRQWYGHDPKGYQDYAEALHAARIGTTDAEARLLVLLQDNNQPAIARATAAAELGPWLSGNSLPVLAEALGDSDPRVRAAAVEALAPLPPERLWQFTHQLLRDPVRGVRALAVAALAGIPVEPIPPGEQDDFRRAADDYLASLRQNADDPGAQVNLGNFRAARGESAEAERAYREALNLDPDWVPAYVNLSDLFRQTDRDAEGEMPLRDGLARQPESAALHHGLGLLQARQNNLPAALASLKRAVDLAPDDTRLVYVYAVALHGSGHAREALTIVEAALTRAPGDQSLNALRSQLTTEGRKR